MNQEQKIIQIEEVKVQIDKDKGNDQVNDRPEILDLSLEQIRKKVCPNPGSLVEVFNEPETRSRLQILKEEFANKGESNLKAHKIFQDKIDNQLKDQRRIAMLTPLTYDSFVEQQMEDRQTLLGTRQMDGVPVVVKWNVVNDVWPQKDYGIYKIIHSEIFKGYVNQEVINKTKFSGQVNCYINLKTFDGSVNINVNVNKREFNDKVVLAIYDGADENIHGRKQINGFYEFQFRYLAKCFVFNNMAMKENFPYLYSKFASFERRCYSEGRNGFSLSQHWE